MAKKYSIPESQWLDLSTGLNPNGWPVPAIPASIWQALPQDEDGLQTAACKYYQCDYCLPVAGSQAAIQALPSLRKFSTVGIVSPTYAEHQQAWQKAGHKIKQLGMETVEQALEQLDVLIVVNPNNPTGHQVQPKTLLDWHQTLSKKGGWLIVDEAFMDSTPQFSLATSGIRPGLIILRSLGKFFGLAGLRCGFVISHHELLTLLAEKTGPWSVSAASRYVATLALQDTPWQTQTRQTLEQNEQRLATLLNSHGFSVSGGTTLFKWIIHSEAKQLFEHFAKQGILVRLFDEPTTTTSSLRFGLPRDESSWLRLTRALNSAPANLSRKTLNSKAIP